MTGSPDAHMSTIAAHFITHGLTLPAQVASHNMHINLPAAQNPVHHTPPNVAAAATSATPSQPPAAATPSRYESQKRRDWNTFGQYLRNHRPPLALAKCSGAHVLEFLRYLDQFGKTKVHTQGCPFFGQPQPPAACGCPLRQAWGSLDALIGRLRAAFEENGGKPESNPFGARAVRLYLREVREVQAKARGIAYEKKKRKRQPNRGAAATTSSSSSTGTSMAAAVTTSMAAAAPALIPSDHTYHHYHLQQAAGPSMIPSFN